ncbi:MAG: tRNA 2-thiouridine(34) synthase MnmA, partial [Acidimicrobiia bacterium]|nr:tRNA 2-thiouridine(34) synthase MnmA [Acidimicrobiia bacterium]
AADLGLRTANKPESMDICFVGKRDYREFLRGEAPDVFTPGRIVDTDGTDLGDHDGIAGFTIGQRRGLGVSVGEPRFVSEIDPTTSTVTLGRRQDLETRTIEIEQVSSVGGTPVTGGVLAQYRAHGEAAPAVVSEDKVVFDEPQEAIASGQTVAFYRNSEVMGGAVISRRGV